MNFSTLFSSFTCTSSIQKNGPEQEPPSQLHFDIDPVTGFVPPEPLPRLCREFKIWEDVLEEAPDVLKLGDDISEEALALKAKGEAWRAHIRAISILDIVSLKAQPRILQRAHVVLAWLVQYYVHSLPPSVETKRVPASLAVPLVGVSRLLGIAPVITFSDTITWNWELIRPGDPVTIDNMAVVHNFTGREDERHFYQVQAAIELHGVQILQIIEEYTKTSHLDEPTISKIAGNLTRMTVIIEEINDLIQSIRTGCDPHVFYWEMRPWFNGNDAKGPSDPGWIYEGVDPDVPELKYLSGPSGGQSAVMHALDLFLDISHDFEGGCSTNKPADRGFMNRMRLYMLGKHRAYLEQLQKSPRPIRELAKYIPALREPYNDAIAALKKLRSFHMRIAVMYITNMARASSLQPRNPEVGVDKNRQEVRVESGNVTKSNRPEQSEPVRGSGGSDFAPLLRAGIDATARASLRDP
ncbi:hypothetical protein GYMLUDRAFT_207248 [Collybiopsis luxurians FD-317 M1]|uniref:Unplaced genomic scaffold GYMLUscaffold_77, whole genome shotgun sequence n=1 Tax=Collybiopsis luxurians FD-317 M1 TaxID=944289 RepID=A0A0D0CFH1_9AGAR|nr:hypothetical protein GYMLUDRAFT_207248 [Collybiopsis luxurians FD-317 M1]